MDSHVRERESLVPSRRQALCLGAALVTVPTGVLALAMPAPSLAAPMPAPLTPDDPLQRARAAWLAFATAMDELAVPGDGWMLAGAGMRRAAHGRPAEAWVYASRLTYEWRADPRFQRGGFLDEIAEPIDLWRKPPRFPAGGADMNAHTREFVMVERQRLRERAERTIEALIGLLDELDGDSDEEDGDEAEDEIDYLAEWGRR